MNCAEARHHIHTADPVALRERSDAGFAAHVGACAACASAAGHVVGDVDRLRAALAARRSMAAAPRRPRTRNKVVVTMIPVALAAELALFAFLSNRNTVNPIIDRAVIDDSVTTLLPAAHTEVDTGEVIAAPARKNPILAIAGVTPDTAEDADSLAEKPVADAMSAPVGAQLQVIPRNPREHVAVIATSDPKVTVVWITKGDTL